AYNRTGITDLSAAGGLLGACLKPLNILDWTGQGGAYGGRVDGRHRVAGSGRTAAAGCGRDAGVDRRATEGAAAGGGTLARAARENGLEPAPLQRRPAPQGSGTGARHHRQAIAEARGAGEG